jgi:hypothetical protein
MNKHLTPAILATFATLTTLTACSNVDDEQYADFTSPVEATFTGKVSAAQTRADDAEEWSTEYTTIGISAKTLTKSERTTAQYANVRYTATPSSDDATNAALTPVSTSTDSTFYFQTPKERASFVAYAPYIDTTATTTTPDLKNGVITLHAKSETDGSENYNVTDYIRAETGTLNYLNNTEALEFTHQMSKLNINVDLSDEVSGKTASSSDANNYTYTTTIKDVTLSNLITDGTLTLSTGDIALTDGATARTVSLEVESDGVTATLSDYIVIPQSGLVVTITTDDEQTYQTTLSKSLVSGNAYTFNITAKKSAVEVTATIVPWNTTGNSVGDVAKMKHNIKQFDVFDEVDLVQQYDLAFSDGTFMRIAGSDGSIPTSIPDNVLTEDLKAKLSGIVYYIGDVTDDDPTLKREHPGCTHGLIVALDNAAVFNDQVYWQNLSCFEDVYANFQNAKGSLYSEENDYKKIQVYVNYDQSSSKYVYGTEDYGLFSLKLGFNNTFVLRKYNEVKTGNQVNPVLKVDAYAKTNTAPEGSSGWYLPSPMEMALLCENVNELSLKSESITTNTVMEKLDKVFTLLSNAFVTCTDLNNKVTKGSYWTSLEGSKDYAFAFFVSYSSSYAYLFYSIKRDSYYFSVRAVCAF